MKILVNEFARSLKTLVFVLFDTWVLIKKNSYSQRTRLSVVIVRMDALGDFIIWLDTAKEYRKIFPPDKYRITLIGNALWTELAKELSHWDEVIPVETKHFKSLSRYRHSILQYVRNLNADIAIQPTYSPDIYYGDSIIRVSGARERIGSLGDLSNSNRFKYLLRRMCYTRLIPVNPETMHELKRNAEFFSGLSEVHYQAELPVLNLDNRHNFKSLLPDEQHYFVVAPGASDVIKQWPVQRFAEVILEIQKKKSGHVFL